MGRVATWLRVRLARQRATYVFPALLAVTAMALGACAAVPPPTALPDRAYDGPARASELVAVIERTDHDYIVGGWRAELESVDGNPVNPSRVEVLPGHRTIGIGGKICVAGVCSGTVPATIAFTAVAGKRYRVDCDYWLSEVALVDAATDEVLVTVVCEDGRCHPPTD